MTAFRAERTVWDDGRYHDGHPRTRDVWIIEGPEPFGGLVAKDEVQAREVAERLTEWARLAEVAAARRVDRAATAAEPRPSDDFVLADGTRMRRGDAFEWASLTDADREGCVRGAPSEWPDSKRTALILEAVFRDHASRHAVMKVTLASGQVLVGEANVNGKALEHIVAVDQRIVQIEAVP